MSADRRDFHRTCLYDSRELAAKLGDMARETAGLLTARRDVTLVGIRRRGVPIADMLRERLERDYGFARLPTLALQIKRYADDLTVIHPETQLIEDPVHAALDLRGKTVVVVDDVIYQGHSMLRAVDYLAQKRPAEIRTVVLVDRDVSRLPVRADIVGARLDVAPDDIIECNVPPFETEFRIDLCKPLGPGG